MMWIKVNGGAVSKKTYYINLENISYFFYDGQHTVINMNSSAYEDDRRISVFGDITKELASILGKAVNCSVYQIKGD